VVTDGGSRRDARGRAGDEADAVGQGAGSRDGRKPSPLDLPPTERKRGDGELVN
jgi:hypothetical protein